MQFLYLYRRQQNHCRVKVVIETVVVDYTNSYVLIILGERNYNLSNNCNH